MKYSTIALTLATFTLAACSTSSLTEEEQAPVEPTDTPFSGQVREIDPTQSVISFTGKSNVINHEGKFDMYTAEVALDDTDPSDLEKATISAEIDMASAETDADGLNGHLQREDFFDVANYPTATFVSTSIVSKGDNMYGITGDLTVKGTTKSITVDAEITDEYLTATYDFPRKEFGVGNDNYGDKLLDPTVPVSVKLVFQQ